MAHKSIPHLIVNSPYSKPDEHWRTLVYYLASMPTLTLTGIENHAVASILITGSSNRSEILLSSNGFRAIDTFLSEHKLEWSQFWPIYINYVIYSLSSFVREKNSEFTAPLPSIRPRSELEMVDTIKQVMAIPDFGLLGRDLLRKLDSLAQTPIRLLFDGLDTGFGSSNADQRRRKAALEGLFSLYLGLAESLKNFQFKILLREDIWRQLQFENKSHFFGKTETNQNSPST